MRCPLSPTMTRSGARYFNKAATNFAQRSAMQCTVGSKWSARHHYLHSARRRRWLARATRTDGSVAAATRRCKCIRCAGKGGAAARSHPSRCARISAAACAADCNAGNAPMHTHSRRQLPARGSAR
eukprot:IDg22079t1